MFGRRQIGRPEKQVRSLARGLFWAGGALLFVSIGMTASFGVSIGEATPDKVLMGSGAALVDIAAALAVAFCGAAFGQRFYLPGFVGLGAAMFLMAVSGLAIYGYQSGTRVAVVEKARKVETLDQGQLEWLREQTVKGARVDRQSMVDEVKEQYKAMRGSVAGPADPQVRELAKMSGTDEDTARRWVVTAMASVILIAEFFCIWAGAFIRQRLEPFVAAQAVWRMFSPRKAQDNKSHNSNNSIKSAATEQMIGHTQMEALEHLRVLVRGGLDLGKHGVVSTLAREWGWDRQRVRRFIAAHPEFNLPPPRSRQKARSVHNGENFTVPPNGKAHPA